MGKNWPSIKDVTSIFSFPPCNGLLSVGSSPSQSGTSGIFPPLPFQLRALLYALVHLSFYCIVSLYIQTQRGEKVCEGTQALQLPAVMWD